jgi:hypothetical protein
MIEGKQISERDSLALISSMVNKAKNTFSETGKLYIIWGWLIFLCCLVQFLALKIFDKNISYIWFSTWVLLIYQIFFLRKKRRLRKVRTYTEEINGFVWLVFFICLLILAFIGIQFEQYQMIDPMILVLYGMPTFLSGIILKFRPLIVGGIICWLLAILSTFVNINFQLLLVAAGVAAGWIIPGYILKSRFKKNIANQNNGI